MYSANGKNRKHSGEGHALENVIIFVVLFAILLGGFYATSWAHLFSDPAAWWPMIGVIGGGFVSFGIGVHAFGHSDTHPDRTANDRAAELVADTEYREALGQHGGH